jgi:prevent-host-death family protein
MCYMSTNDARVGVRELRQNLSKYLRRVVRGEILEVTDRGRPVALLTPLPAGSSPLERLIASGRAVRPEGDLMELLPPEGPASTDLSEALREERAERL